MNEKPSPAVATTAESLVEETPQIPVKKPRAPWPAAEPFKETYPGSKVAQHPTDKRITSVAQAKELGCVIFPANQPGTATATPPPAPAPSPAPAPTIPPQPATAPAPEPVPDFSDLNGPKPGEAPQADPVAAMESHKTLGGMFHATIVGIFVMIFGEGFKTAAEEENRMIELWAKCLEWWNAKILTPPQQLAAAYGCYVTARIGILLSFIKAKMAARKKRTAAPSPANPPGETATFRGVNVTEAPAKQPQPAPVAESEPTLVPQ